MTSQAANSSSNVNIGRQVAGVRSFEIDPGLLLSTVPPAPEMLRTEGQNYWNYYCSMMIDCKILSRMFLTSLTNLCILHDNRADYCHTIGILGAVIHTKVYNDEGTLVRVDSKKNPIVKDLESTIKLMDSLLASLGMTAYTAKVNKIDTSGMKKKRSQGPPVLHFEPPAAKVS